MTTISNTEAGSDVRTKLNAALVVTDILTTPSANGASLVKAADYSAMRTLLGLGALATATPGTGVTTALAANIGSAGAPVTYNGALGTPSSGVATNLTGLPIGGISATGTPSSSTFLRGDGTWTTPGGAGTVTSVSGAGTVNGLSLTGTVTGSGNLTLGGTLTGIDLTAAVTGALPVANGGTGATSAATARTALGVTATGADTTYAARASNLSDLASASTARTNLGVSATGADTTYNVKSANLSDVANAGTARTNLGLAIGTDVQAFDSDLASIAALTTTSYGRGLLTLADAAAGRTAYGLGSIATYAEATAAEYRAATASRALSAANVWSAAAVVALTDAATIAVDMSTFLNASVTLGGNRTLGNPSNPKVGQSGFILITQDGTGTRTLAYASNWKYAGGAGTIPALSTAAASIDVLTYLVLSSTSILITGIQKAVA